MKINGTKDEYYIELPKDKKSRKALIDSIIEKSNGTFAENIKYYTRK